MKLLTFLKRIFIRNTKPVRIEHETNRTIYGRRVRLIITRYGWHLEYYGDSDD